MMFVNRYLIIITFFVTCSCSSVSNNIAPGYSDAFKLAKDYLYGSKDNINKELVNAIPYASMKVQIGRGPVALLILEQILNDVEYWVSADKAYIAIKNGRIVQTSGLTNNLIGTTSFENPLNSGNTYTFLNNYQQPRLDSFKISASVKKKQTVEIELINGTKTLTLYEETVKNDFIGWNATNRYWMDSNGFIWKSEQNISPKLPTIYIQITKKPT